MALSYSSHANSHVVYVYWYNDYTYANNINIVISILVLLQNTKRMHNRNLYFLVCAALHNTSHPSGTKL